MENRNKQIFKTVREEYIPKLAKRVGEHSANIIFEHIRGISYKMLGVKSGAGLEITNQKEQAIAIMQNLLSSVLVNWR